MTAQIWDQLAAIGESKPDAWDELPPLVKWAQDCPPLPDIKPRMYLPTEVESMLREYALAAVARERERAIDIVAMFGGSVEIEAAIRRG